MKLLEHEGKELFRTHGIATPEFELLSSATSGVTLPYPLVLKSQVAAGDRMKKGGIAIVKDEAELRAILPKLFALVIDGLKPEVILAEVGADLSRFPSAGHLASWAGLCPGQNESAGKRRSGRTRKGSAALREALTEAARAAARTRRCYLAAQYRRIAARRGAN